MAYDITLEKLPTGYRVYKDKIFLVGNINTKDDRGFSKGGEIIHQEMPPESWTIHLTDPAIPVDLLKAIVAALPTEA